LVVDVQRTLACGQVVRTQDDIDPARWYDDPVGGRLFVPIAIDQAGRGRRFDEVRAVEFRYEEIAQRCIGDIHRITDDTRTALVGVQYPTHITGRVGDRLGDLHEHAVDPAGSVKDP